MHLVRRVSWCVSAVAVLALLPAAWSSAADAPDPSTPKGVTYAFAQAMSKGEGDKAKSLVLDDAANQQLIGTFVTVGSARRKLHDAAQDKFGKDDITSMAAAPTAAGRRGAAAGGPAAGSAPVERFKDIESAEEKIDGDTAKVYGKEAGPDHGVTLKKSGGAWKIDLASLVPSAQGDRWQQMAGVIAKVQNDVADDIKADKYKTSEEATAAYRQKMREAIMAQYGAGGARPRP
jgi:hypothetical protein